MNRSGTCVRITGTARISNAKLSAIISCPFQFTTIWSYQNPSSPVAETFRHPPRPLTRGSSCGPCHCGFSVSVESFKLSNSSRRSRPQACRNLQALKLQAFFFVLEAVEAFEPHTRALHMTLRMTCSIHQYFSSKRRRGSRHLSCKAGTSAERFATS